MNLIELLDAISLGLIIAGCSALVFLAVLVWLVFSAPKDGRGSTAEDHPHRRIGDMARLSQRWED